jgi:CRP/FNR family transcriptional regulator
MQVITRNSDIGALACSAILEGALGHAGKGPEAWLLLSLWDTKTKRSAKGACEAIGPCHSLLLDELGLPDAMMSDVRYAHHEILFDQDDPDDCVQVVTNGAVRLYRTLADGRRSVLGFALPGDFLGLSINDGRAMSAEALGSVSTYKISRQAFSELVDSNPRWMHMLHDEVSHELSLAYDHMTLLGRYTARERTAAFLVTLRNRWKRANGKSVHVALPMTRGDIGDYLGLTIETVSRMISTLVREKLIMIVPDGVRILDFARLEAIVGR